MKIVPIYDGYIYSVSYDESGEEDNEFDRLLSLWNDVSYLSDFFRTNAAYLSNETWQKVRLPEMAAHQVTGRLKTSKTCLRNCMTIPKREGNRTSTATSSISAGNTSICWNMNQ